MERANLQQFSTEYDVDGDLPIITSCMFGHRREDLCPRCFNEVTPDVQGHCPICDYCIYCEI